MPCRAAGNRPHFHVPYCGTVVAVPTGEARTNHRAPIVASISTLYLRESCDSLSQETGGVSSTLTTSSSAKELEICLIKV
ncbi:hypothetical protein J6590_009785 [Homalodisca vitripennis]|nr:hypothetical protein J6590_009785 [Homalodisca vitripennis]